MRRPQTHAIALCAVACALGPPAAARADVSGSDITAFLNAQRAAQGIPAGIVEDSALSDGCAKHNAYGAANQVLTHGEDPATPGYTPEGDRAGKTSVLYGAGGGPWTAARNPFETAPIHLHQLLAPRIDRIGASENQGYGCATTLASRDRPAPPADVTYTYPGNGARDWPPAQTAVEGPYTPGQQVGIPAGAKTGPYLYAMFDGPDLTVFDTATATGATLSGPGGPVAVAVADNRTPGLEGYLPTGLQVVPRAPLAPQATYTATVAASVTTQGGSGPARSFSRSWSFTTRGLENTVRITRLTIDGRRVRVSASSDAPGAILTAEGPGTTASEALGADGAAGVTLDADGTWNLCVRSGGGRSGYLASQDCRPVPVRQAALPTGSPAVTVSTRVRPGSPIRIAVTSQEAYSLRLVIETLRGRTIVSNPSRSLAGGGTWISQVVVPRRYSRSGRKLRVRLFIRTAARRYAIRRSVRFG